MKLSPLLPLVLLAACHAADKATPPTKTTAETPSETGAPVLSQARIVLPAVNGNPAAAYFTLTNGKAPVTLARIAVAGAGMAMMHETKGEAMVALNSLALTPGEKALFAPGGKHVMLFDLDPKLVAGGSVELSAWFDDGSRVAAKARIEAAGGMGADAMEHPR